MERDNHDNIAGLIELGSVTSDTKGSIGSHWEAGGLQPYPGISDD